MDKEATRAVPWGLGPDDIPSFSHSGLHSFTHCACNKRSWVPTKCRAVTYCECDFQTGQNATGRGGGDSKPIAFFVGHRFLSRVGRSEQQRP